MINLNKVDFICHERVKESERECVSVSHPIAICHHGLCLYVYGYVCANVAHVALLICLSWRVSYVVCWSVYAVMNQRCHHWMSCTALFDLAEGMYEWMSVVSLVACWHR